jgi:hypothetical protein
MQSNDSDLQGIETLKRLPRTVRKWFEMLVVLCGLVGGGMGVGYWGGIQQERADRIAEIERLRQAYDQRLSNLSGRVGVAADTAATAAARADDAASAAQNAAQAAKQAATSAAAKPVAGSRASAP